MKIVCLCIILLVAFQGWWEADLNIDASAGPVPQDQVAAMNLLTPDSLRPHIVKLADDKFEGRGAGYVGERKAAEYIAEEFKRIGLTPAGDSVRGRRGYFQEFKFHPFRPVVPWETMTSRNVLGSIEGTDPMLKTEIVVIGAHYDGQGRSGQADPVRLPASAGNDTRDEIWNSANDNAASIAAILEIARAFKRAKITTRRTILFVAFGAEEHGMAGSIYYVGHPISSLTNHVAMVNLEKLGRSPEKPLTVGGASGPGWQEVIKAAKERTKTAVTAVPFTTPDSDHYPFGAVRIPAVMMLVSTSVDAHQPSDTADKIDFARTAEAARYAMAMVLTLADQTARLSYTPSPIPDFGLIGSLATSAEADAAGLSGEESGLKVTGVIPGLPSAEAGLMAGDLILEFANYKFRRSATLQELIAKQREVLEGKFGNSLAVTVLRAKQRSQRVIKLR